MNQSAGEPPDPAGDAGVHPLTHTAPVHQLTHEDEQGHGNQDEAGVALPGLVGHDVPQGSIGEEEHYDERQGAQRGSHVHPRQEEGPHQSECDANSHSLTSHSGIGRWI